MRSPVAASQVVAAVSFGRLEFLPLPPYAPELNPEEMPNAELKCHRLVNRSPATLEQLERLACGRLMANARDPDGIEAIPHVELQRTAG